MLSTMMSVGQLWQLEDEDGQQSLNPDGRGRFWMGYVLEHFILLI